MKVSLGLLGFVAANAASNDDDRLITNKDDWETNFSRVSCYQIIEFNFKQDYSASMVG